MNDIPTSLTGDFKNNIKTKLKAKKAYNIDEMENEFKSKINFSDMLDKNYKDVEESPVSDLIKSTTQSVVSKQEDSSENISERLDLLEDKLQINSVNEKMERVEGLLQSLIINQQNLQHSLQSEIKDRLVEFKTDQQKRTPAINEDVRTVKEVGSSRNSLIALATSALIVIASLIFAFNSSKESSVNSPVQVKIEAPKKVLKVVATPKFVTTKFVNLRVSASTKAKIEFIVPPNSIVERLEHKAGWNKIKFKNHIKSTSLTGWVYGENLKELN
ncbi:MAG: hypothetical protein BM556_02835 [Bacteriovorax sp. MedPE-SWde]|nr:MAG: hypothetical protein BM556_02835 [Bacteriovorax sp. MedPE-SWde]